MDGHSRMSKGLYEELYDYATLEAAYEAAFLYLDDAPEDSEAWLINLQNHLVWRSYEPGQNPDEDMSLSCWGYTPVCGGKKFSDCNGILSTWTPKRRI